MLPLAGDESLHGDIVRGVRRRVPDIDLVLVEEAGLRGSTDPQVLEWAAAEGRVVVTQDENTMTGHAWDRVRTGMPMPGVVVCGQGVTIGGAIDELEIIAGAGLPEDFRDQVRFVPL
jgi:hypothetical protein